MRQNLHLGQKERPRRVPKLGRAAWQQQGDVAATFFGDGCAVHARLSRPHTLTLHTCMRPSCLSHCHRSPHPHPHPPSATPLFLQLCWRQGAIRGINMVRTASTWQEAEENIVSCTAQILNQAIEILRSGAIDDASYTFSSRVIAGSTPGKHFRHVLDHLRILLDSIEAWQARSSSVLRVDYDSRMSSKVAHIETSVAASAARIRTNQQSALPHL